MKTFIFSNISKNEYTMKKIMVFRKSANKLWFQLEIKSPKYLTNYNNLYYL